MVKYSSSPIRIADGMLYADEQGTLFVGNHGERVLFRGVRVRLGGTLPNTAFQLNGCIRIGRKWQSTFTSTLLAHEYGHFLQQRQLGAWRYAWLALKSMLSVVYSTLLRRHNHFTRSFERNATYRGQRYILEEKSGGEVANFA